MDRGTVNPLCTTFSTTGSFIDDVMQVGEREGGQLCDTHYKDVSKTVILM